MNQTYLLAAAVTDVAPWWGVPVVAGCFLMVGAVLGFVFNRSNETKKFTREREVDRTAQLVTAGTDLLTAAAEVRTLVADSIGKRDWARDHIEADENRALDFYLHAANRFALVMPVEAAETLSNLSAIVLLTANPIFDAASLKLLLHEHDEKASAITNLLRKNLGLEPLPSHVGRYKAGDSSALVEDLLAFADRLNKRESGK